MTGCRRHCVFMSVLNSRNFASFFETKMAITFERVIFLGSSTTRCNPREALFPGVHNLHRLFYKNALKHERMPKNAFFTKSAINFEIELGVKNGSLQKIPLVPLYYVLSSKIGQSWWLFKKEIICEIDQLADFLTFFAFFDHFWASISPKMLIRPQRFFEN